MALHLEIGPRVQTQVGPQASYLNFKNTSPSDHEFLGVGGMFSHSIVPALIEIVI